MKKLGLLLPAVLLLGMFLAVEPAHAISAAKAEMLIRDAYNDILGRDPDPAGMKEYRKRMVDEGWSEDRIRDALKKSDEAKRNRTDIIIKRAYRDMLGREPDAAGLKEYRRMINEEGWSEDRIRETLKKSDEAKRNRAVVIVKRAYRQVLGREADPGGLKTYCARVNKDGWSEGDVKNDLKKSDEYRKKFGND